MRMGVFPMGRATSTPRRVVCGCGQSFETTHSQGKYCSAKCAREGERASWREYGKRNKAARKKLGKVIRQRDPAHQRDRNRKWAQTPSGRQSVRAKDRRMRERFPEKYAARQEVLKALRRGDLIKAPCRCGATKVQGHHPDYSKPLDVIWLCDPCHRAEEGRVAA